MHTVFALLCFVVVIHWLIFPYPSGLLHWHCGNLTIAPVPAKQPWWIWINTSCEFIMNDCVTTTKQSTTKPCACFLGYTVHTRSKPGHDCLCGYPYNVHAVQREYEVNWIQDKGRRLGRIHRVVHSIETSFGNPTCYYLCGKMTMPFGYWGFNKRSFPNKMSGYFLDHRGSLLLYFLWVHLCGIISYKQLLHSI